MNYPLSELEEPLRLALQRLTAKAEDLHPFVVIDKVGRPDIFVQFATHKGTLFFDVPRLEIVLEKTTVETGAADAIGALGFLGVACDERVNINEEEDQPPPWKGEPFWKRLFA